MKFNKRRYLLIIPWAEVTDKLLKVSQMELFIKTKRLTNLKFHKLNRFIKITIYKNYVGMKKI
jgi:hypothetical protein